MASLIHKPATYQCSILNTYFYTTLLNEQGTSQRFQFDRAVRFTNHFNPDYLQHDIIIPIHRPNHWILAVLSPPQRSLYLIDSFRGQYSNVVENLIRWYREECTRSEKTCNIDEWNVISGQNLPFLLPIQTDGTSCGVFTGMTAYYWITQQRLPSTSDWNQSCVPQMRKFMLHLISRSMRHIFNYMKAKPVNSAPKKSRPSKAILIKDWIRFNCNLCTLLFVDVE